MCAHSSSFSLSLSLFLCSVCLAGARSGQHDSQPPVLAPFLPCHSWLAARFVNLDFRLPFFSVSAAGWRHDLFTLFFGGFLGSRSGQHDLLTSRASCAWHEKLMGIPACPNRADPNGISYRAASAIHRGHIDRCKNMCVMLFSHFLPLPIDSEE